MNIYMIRTYVGEYNYLVEDGAFLTKEAALRVLDKTMENLTKNDHVMSAGIPVNCELVEIKIVDAM